jgi:hypothetical protein
MTAIASSTFALKASPRDRAAARREAWGQLREMSRVMIEEEGLINYAQGGLVLNVSTKRVSELVRLGKLKRFDFLGRTYVSLKEVCDRAERDLKAGRPKRNIAERVSTVVRLLRKSDAVQLGAAAVPPKRERKKK